MSEPSQFAEAIAKAAKYEDFSKADANDEWSPGDDATFVAKSKSKRPEAEQAALAEANAAFEALAKMLSEKHGYAIIYTRPRVSRKRTSAEYNFWRRPVMAFIEDPKTLDIGPVDLARMYAPSESFNVTKDTIRAPLSGPARKAAGQLLKSRNFDLKLPANFSIRDIQKEMKDQRDRAEGVVKFKPTIEIVGNTVFRDGKSFEMQPAGPVKKRIQVGKRWLSVETLTAFLSG